MELLPAPGEWQESDYFLFSERGRLVELSDGNIEVLDLPVYFHQLILLRLSFLLHAFVEAQKLGRVCFAPLPVRLWPGKIREPDLMFMAAANAGRIGAYWGVPDLAVEILSPSTELKDRTTKRAEYAMAGVAEYWIVDPAAKSIEVLSGSCSGGTWQSAATYLAPGQMISPLLPGLLVRLEDLFIAE